MIVCKFGGSSIGNSSNIINVKDILLQRVNNEKLIIVFSAIGKTTDLLIQVGNISSSGKEYKTELNNIIEYHMDIIKNLGITDEIFFEEFNKLFKNINDICKGLYYLKDFSNKNCDYLISHGERLSNLIIFYYFKKSFQNKNILLEEPTEYIYTDYNYGNAKIIESKTYQNLSKLSNKEFDLLIFPGFISKNESNYVTTLGRGGGDYTAALIGASLNVSRVEIWTDVNGIMSSDPRIVKNSISIDKISYNEMMELSHYGANIIYTPTILPLYNKRIPIIVKNTFNPEHPGTKIDFENTNTSNIATAISNIKNVCLVKIYGNHLIGNIGFSSKLFSIFSNINVNIIMISQSSSEHSIYVVINNKDYEVTKFKLNQLFEKQIKTNDVILDFWNNKSVLSIETNKNDNINEISARIYPLFRNYNIKIYTQITSDHNICLIIDRKNLSAIQSLIHDEIFFQKKFINVILIGIGLVGNELINQIKSLDNIRIIGLANSKKILYNQEGIELENYKKLLETDGKEYNIDDIIDKTIDCKLFNKVFIDCTSSELIYKNYEKLLNNFVSVVTPNKKANTTNYQLFNSLSKYKNYKYETTVGAGLPVIETIKNLIKNGDKIIKVEAILSGTMSYIFNTYSMINLSFSEVVKNAQKLGFTEPNPKDDLNGMDVVRKILIIARLTGLQLEIDDVHNENFLSTECLESNSTDEFYKNLEDFQENISEIKNIAKSRNNVVKHVATLENNKAKVGLIEIDQTHPFYSLQGSDNMIIITSKYYNENKLIIRGPGAGAEVTAAGIISDIYLSI
tara:strand:- start:478 stop:2865 length:2388 start_codon:yes stop_codon:yes gene_type:complete